MVNPAVRMSSISSMMADLIGDMSDLDDAIRIVHTEVYFSPDASHAATALLLKNHAEVPVWCAFQTKSWFFEGSGGESQC